MKRSSSLFRILILMLVTACAPTVSSSAVPAPAPLAPIAQEELSTPTAVKNLDFGFNSIVIDGETVRVEYWNNSDSLDCLVIESEQGEYLANVLCATYGNKIGFETSILTFSKLEVGMKVQLCDLSHNCSEPVTVQGNSFTKNCYGDFVVEVKFDGGIITGSTCIEDGYTLSFYLKSGEQFNITVSEDFQQLEIVSVGTTQKANVYCTDEGSDQSWICYSEEYAFEVKVTALPRYGGEFSLSVECFGKWVTLTPIDKSLAPYDTGCVENVAIFDTTEGKFGFALNEEGLVDVAGNGLKCSSNPTGLWYCSTSEGTKFSIFIEDVIPANPATAG